MKALVLAGGFPQIALIQELKNRGITTLLADYNKEPVAKKYADVFYQESTQDLDKIEEIARNEKVDFLLTVCSEQAIQAVAIVSERLGLPCYINDETVRRVTNKAYMKKVFEEIGVPNAKHRVLKAEDEFDPTGFEFPMIVKPVDCSGSSGVLKVWNKEELYAAIEEDRKMSKSGSVIVEEFVEGVEISIDAIIVDGKATVVCMTSSDKIADDDRFVIFRGNYPAMDDASAIKPQVDEIVQKIATAFELKNSPLLVQMIYSRGKLYVLEFSARTGGSAKYLLSRKSCGFDLVKAVVDITLGIKPEVGDLKGENKYVSNEYLYCREGMFDHLEGFEEMKQLGVISEYFQFKWKNAQSKGITNSGDRIAGFTVQADTKDEMHRKHHEALKHIRIVDVNGEDMLRRDLVGDLYGDA